MSKINSFVRFRPLLICVIAVLLCISLLYYVPAVKDYISKVQLEKVNTWLGSQAEAQAAMEPVDIQLGIQYGNTDIYATVFPDAGLAKVFLFVDNWNDVEMKNMFAATFLQETALAIENEFGLEAAKGITIIGVDSYDESLSANAEININTGFIARPDTAKSSSTAVVYNVEVFENGSVIWSGLDSELLK